MPISHNYKTIFVHIQKLEVHYRKTLNIWGRNNGSLKPNYGSSWVSDGKILQHLKINEIIDLTNNKYGI